MSNAENTGYWVSTLADRVEQANPRGLIMVASGISPSGPIHMGNMREILTSHFVADELLRRGREVHHLHSWDDYDRFRRVPAGVPGVDDSWEQYIGVPLSAVPAPHGSDHATWAEHFRAPLMESLQALGVEMECRSQSEMYSSGAYLPQITHAMEQRETLGEILAGFQSKGAVLDPREYYPYRPLCLTCGRDYTQVHSWNGESGVIHYSCTPCEEEFSLPLSEAPGKLAWKIDWPMRWVYENVSFEPGGVDHMSPGSSWDAGRLIAPIFGGERPLGERYSFVGFNGAAKMASSKGGAPTPGSVLTALEPEMIRWLYARVRPRQSFDFDLGRNTCRLYDEWDAFLTRAARGTMRPGEDVVYESACSTAHGPVTPGRNLTEIAPVKFSAMASFADLSVGSAEQYRTLVLEVGGSLDERRMALAQGWVNNFMNSEDRIHISPEFREAYHGELSPEMRGAVEILSRGLQEHWEGSELTRWSFGAAKVALGIDVDERNLSPEARAFQREYFTTVYQLLISRDTGPRLPQLLRSLGVERARELLTGE